MSWLFASSSRNGIHRGSPPNPPGEKAEFRTGSRAPDAGGKAVDVDGQRLRFAHDDCSVIRRRDYSAAIFGWKAAISARSASRIGLGHQRSSQPAWMSRSFRHHLFGEQFCIVAREILALMLPYCNNSIQVSHIQVDRDLAQLFGNLVG